MANGKLTGADVASHNSKDSCWVIVHGKAYDVTEFLPGILSSGSIASMHRILTV
jgi:hypothetical protein